MSAASSALHQDADSRPVSVPVTAARGDFVKTEGLCGFDGDPGYSLGQGQ